MRSFQGPGRSPVYAENAVLATSHPLATSAGLDILKTGGNAVDAAIAACATLCVVEPAMTGVGGDCFALYAPAGHGRVLALNGSGRAPAAADPAWYREQNIGLIERQSPHAVTVPGAVAAWAKLSEEYGTKPLAELLEPAVRYAEDGYPIYPRVHYDWVSMVPLLARNRAAADAMLTSGAAPAVGSIHRQPKLAHTLRTIGREGRAGFYEGAVAEDIVDCLRALGGLHTLDDFASMEAAFVEPIQTGYRGYDIYECPPNGQGLCALMILRILAGYDLAALGEVDRVHLLAEAAKLAYYERDRFIGDPDRVPVPVGRLLTEDYADQLRANIDMARAGAFVESDFPAHSDTVYLACVDADGNAISFINSLFSAFGAAIMAPKCGVMLHNRGQSFNLLDGHASCIAPGKRPLHTIIPGMAMRDGALVGPFGVMGGHYQAVGHAHFLSEVIDRGRDPQTAIDAARSFAYDGVLQMEETFDPATYVALAERGHLIERVNVGIGGGQAVLVDPNSGVLVGGSDPRKDGCALGY